MAKLVQWLSQEKTLHLKGKVYRYGDVVPLSDISEARLAQHIKSGSIGESANLTADIVGSQNVMKSQIDVLTEENEKLEAQIEKLELQVMEYEIAVERLQSTIEALTAQSEKKSKPKADKSEVKKDEVKAGNKS